MTLSAFSIMNANSQNLNLDYQDGDITVPLNTSNAMNINPLTGDVNVSTSYDSSQIGDLLGLQPSGTAPAISFNVVENGTSSATINSTIQNNAVYCNKSGLWSGLLTSNPPTTYVTSDSETVGSNGTNYVMTCANTFGITSNNASVSNITTVVAPIVNVSANPTTVNSGGSSTINWSHQNTPTSCTFSNDFPANVTINGPYSFVESNITSNKSFQVSCSNSAGSDSDLATVTLNSTGNAWPSCGGAAAAILNNNEDRTVLAPGSESYDGKYEHFQGMDLSFPWPGGWGDNIHLSLTKNQYIAAQFTTTSTNYEAKFQLTAPNSIEGPGPQAKTIVISECPGDFNVHLDQAKCITNSNVLYWSTTPTPSLPNFFCELEKNKTYYLNIVHSDNSEGDNYQTTDCTTSSSTYCGILANQSEVSF